MSQKLSEPASAAAAQQQPAIAAMAKSKAQHPPKPESQPKSHSSGFIKIDKKALDPTLASLFASSAGPVEAPPKSRYQDRIQRKDDDELSELEDENEVEEEEEEDDSDDDDEEQGDGTSSNSGSQSSADEEEASDSEQSASDMDATLASLKESMLNGAQDNPNKKRKRGDKEEIEDTYLRKLAREEEKEEEQRQKKRKTEKAVKKTTKEDTSSDADSDAEEAEPDLAIPMHESLTQTTSKEAEEVEKASRTVFLANVSTECINSKTAEKALKKHLESFISDLADNNPPHKVESIRYRSTAFDNSLPKRAAFAKKEIMESTTRSTNAYAVYTTKIAAREAVKRLNGSVLLMRHLHVDSVAHPAKVDHRRCVFVGNLPFVDDESQTPAADGEAKKKNKPASDVEEGLWTHFAKAGKIESVRVVRDAATRVGKGFAYVQFYDENGVEAALQLNEQKFPPMLPRKLRVTRCRAEKKNKKDKPRAPPPSTDRRASNGRAGYVAKLTDEQKSLQGRAQSMLGKVAKAHSKEGFVFEGHRAKEGQGKSGLKFKGSGGKKKGPNGRKSRSAAWKKKDKK